MLKSLLATAAVFAALSTFAAPASAEVYAKVEAGISTGTDVGSYALGDNATYGAALGTSVGPIRIEGGYHRLNAEVGPVQAHANDWRASGFLDFPLTDRTSLSLGGGVDYVQAEAVSGPWGVDAEGYGYHVAGQMSHRIADNVIMEFGATYLNADLDVIEANTVAVTAGFRFGL